jgi:hypothetical protein
MDSFHLKRHQKAQHPESIGKDLEFFLEAKRLKIDECNLKDVPETSAEISINQKLNLASYQVAYQIVKSGLPYSAAEIYTKKILTEISDIFECTEMVKNVKKIPILADTVSKKVTKIADVMEINLLTELRNAGAFA